MVQTGSLLKYALMLSAFKVPWTRWESFIYSRINSAYPKHTLILCCRWRGRTCGILETPAALDDKIWTHVPPAARLTIRDPGIFTSVGYGIPCPYLSLRPSGSFLKPSLPSLWSLQWKPCHDQERWISLMTDPHTKTLGRFRPLYRFFHPD